MPIRMSVQVARGGERWERKMRPSVESRFWSNVSFPAGARGCWLWCGRVNRGGYGVFRPDQRSQQVLAHRWSLSRKLGRPIEGMALHSCDVRPCINPSHLREGTNAENMADAMERGRWSPPPRNEHLIGSKQHTAKLTEVGVAEIRRRYAAGEPRSALAKEYGVHVTTICRAISGEQWGHVKENANV